MLRRQLLATLFAAGLCVIIWAERGACEGDPIPEVDLEALAKSPQEYAGRLVKVQGIVSFDFEESALLPPDGFPFPSLWLDIPDDDGRVREKLDAGTRVLLGVSFDQYSGWSDDAIAALPSWQTVEAAKPVTVVKNKLWKKFGKIGWGCPTAATLIGRFDALPGPGVLIRGAHGYSWTSSGYGHMDGYPFRLVVAQVVALEAGKHCKKR